MCSDVKIRQRRGLRTPATPAFQESLSPKPTEPLANHAILGFKSSIQFAWSVFDPANGVTNVEFYANGVKIGQTNAPPYSLLWSKVPGSSYEITARAVSSASAPAISSPITILVDNGGAPRLTVSALGNGLYSIIGDEVLGRAYHLRFLGDPGATNWQILGSATGSPSGTFQFIDSNAVPQRLYRSLFP
jgi:hypothetical protein